MYQELWLQHSGIIGLQQGAVLPTIQRSSVFATEQQKSFGQSAAAAIATETEAPVRLAIEQFNESVPADSRLLSNPNITCFVLDTGVYTHVCTNLEKQITIDDTLPPLRPYQACFTDNVTDGSRTKGECSSLCILASPIPGIDGQTTQCTSCALLENGEFVYDCKNLFPNAACPARDGKGYCQDYIHWLCSRPPRAGLGYFCQVQNEANNPAFIYDSIPNSDIATTLFCSNDIAGLNASDCEDPLCAIILETGACADCKVVSPPANLDKSDISSLVFTYDCLTAIPDLACGKLLENGTCSNRSVDSIQPDNTTYWNVPTFLVESQRSFNEDDQGTGWTLKNIDPTAFNVMMDIYDKIIMLLFGAAMAIFFPTFLSWQLKRDKVVAACDLGHVPGDFWNALRSFRSWQLSVFGVTLVSLVIVADFAHSIADAGLGFVPVQEKGGMDTVLALGTSPGKRNPHRPMETAGDPALLRTFANNLNNQQGNWEASRPESSALGEYLAAVALIARGGSPFAQQNQTSWRVVAKALYAQVNASWRNYYVDHDAAPLVEMDLEVPLDCYDVEMAKNERIALGNEMFDDPIEMVAWVPNCTLTAKRPSGIYGASSKSAEIVEMLEINDILYLTDQGANIRLTNGTQSFVSFMASPASKKLARDREDWTKGREFFDVDGLEIGNLSIPFASVFLASGTNSAMDVVDNITPRKEYALVAEVDGNCPPRPSGLHSGDEQCMVLILLQCDSFPEDSAIIVHDIYAPQIESSKCDLIQFSIVWGKHYEADQELVSVVAGIFGMTRPSLWRNSVRTFYQNGVFAALFAMGLVEERRSIKEVVRPRVSVAFVVFMALPLFLSVSFALFAIWARRHTLHIPGDTWELLVTGAEDFQLIPKRNSKADSFPEVDDNLVFTAFYDARQDEEDPLSEETIVYGLTKRQNPRIQQNSDSKNPLLVSESESVLGDENEDLSRQDENDTEKEACNHSSEKDENEDLSRQDGNDTEKEACNHSSEKDENEDLSRQDGNDNEKEASNHLSEKDDAIEEYSSTV